MRRLIPLLLLLAAPAMARIKLAALPERERVEIRLDHAGATLVEEERVVPLLRGANKIDFSWSSTRIDKESIQLRPLAIREKGQFRPLRPIDGKPEIAVISASYPPGENALVWDLFAREACALKVRVSYLMGGLERTFAYRAVADRAEERLTLRKYLHFRNASGESFGDAGVWAGFGPAFSEPIGSGEDWKLLLQRFDGVPIRKSYTFDWHAHGPLNPEKPLASKVLMHYRLTNSAATGLGRFPLQGGKVRIFLEDGKGGEAFLGEDWSTLVPLDGEMRLLLGEARDVVCTRTIATNQRHPVEGNLFHQEVAISYEIENFKDGAVPLDLIEDMNALAREFGADPHGEAEWELGPRTSPAFRITQEQGGARPILHVDLPARPADPTAKVEKLTLIFHFTIKNLW